MRMCGHRRAGKENNGLGVVRKNKKKCIIVGRRDRWAEKALESSRCDEQQFCFMKRHSHCYSHQLVQAVNVHSELCFRGGERQFVVERLHAGHLWWWLRRWRWWLGGGWLARRAYSTEGTGRRRERGRLKKRGARSEALDATLKLPTGIVRKTNTLFHCLMVVVPTTNEKWECSPVSWLLLWPQHSSFCALRFAPPFSQHSLRLWRHSALSFPPWGEEGNKANTKRKKRNVRKVRWLYCSKFIHTFMLVRKRIPNALTAVLSILLAS